MKNLISTKLLAVALMGAMPVFTSMPTRAQMPATPPPIMNSSQHSPVLEKRDRAWLLAFATQPLPEAPRSQRYLARLEAGLDNTLNALDLDWLQNGGGEGYRARAQTNIIGRLAFAYHTPQSKLYRNPQLLEKLRLAYLGVARHTTSEGQFIWPGDKDMYWAGSHEHAWRLEPLLMGRLWLGDALPAQDRTEIDAALQRASEWLFRHPLKQTNNRGAVWCAVMMLCALYYDNNEYRQAAIREAQHILPAVALDSGEVGEHTRQYGGGGPDSNYSYTGWSYVYLYRLMSGDTALDSRLQQSLRWFSFYNSISGAPLVAGASVRRRYADPGSFRDLLPALERYSKQEPFFATLAEHALQKPGKMAVGSGGHIISPFLWALLEGGVAPVIDRPAWHLDHTEMFDHPEVQYLLVSRPHYQTGVTSRGRLREGYNYPLRGLQSFAWRDELPILLHTDETNSETRADGINTAAQNVSEGPHGWEAYLAPSIAVPGKAGSLSTLTERRGTLWTLYAFTPASTVVVYGGARSTLESRWVMNRIFVSQPDLQTTSRQVSFEGREGRLHYLRGEAELLPEENDAATLRVTSASMINAFAFSDASFSFGKYSTDSRELRFRDASGAYRLALGGVLDAEGNLARGTAFLRPE